MKNRIVKLITGMVFSLSLVGLAHAGQPISDDCPNAADDYQCCVVANIENPETGDTTDYPDSFHNKVQYFNASGTQSRKCREKISFAENATTINIHQNMSFRAKTRLMMILNWAMRRVPW